MHISAPPRIKVGRELFYSKYSEIVVVLAFGVALPIVAALVVHPTRVVDDRAAIMSVVGVSVCALLMIAALRRINRYAGASVAKSILPTLGGLYGLLLTVITVLRFEYSNIILLCGFVGTLTARYAILTVRTRAAQPIFFVVPGGQVDVVRQLDDIILLHLEEPALPYEQRRVAFIADLRHDYTDEWERFLAEAAIQGFGVYHYKQVWEARAGRVQIDHLSENSFGSLLPTSGYNKMKRVVDFLAALLLLPVFIPVFLIVALAIKLDSDGPVFFRQCRMGYRGREFKVVKFRTMSVLNDGKHKEASITASDDDRITRVGRFLRKTRLDELPQIYNILCGEMSWIGPRPEAISLSHWYEGQIPFYRYRHIVRPGISGWAQVNQGHVTSLSDVTAKLQYDFYYIKNVSYWLDLLIVFKTAKTVVSGFGAK